MIEEQIDLLIILTGRSMRTMVPLVDRPIVLLLIDDQSLLVGWPTPFMGLVSIFRLLIARLIPLILISFNYILPKIIYVPLSVYTKILKLDGIRQVRL